MSASSLACSSLGAVAVADCPEHQHQQTAALGQVDHLAEAVADPSGPACGAGAGEDTDSSVPGLCLSGGPGQVARGTVAGLRLSQGAEYFAHDAVSGFGFSQDARSVSLALLSRRQEC